MESDPTAMTFSYSVTLKIIAVPYLCMDFFFTHMHEVLTPDTDHFQNTALVLQIFQIMALFII